MATIHNTIQRVAGGPQAAEIKIKLLWDIDDRAIPTSTEDDVTFEGDYEMSSDSEGYWSASLLSNDSILPADNVYEITETVEQDDFTVTYYIFVPDTASPTYFVGDVLVSKPDWVE